MRERVSERAGEGEIQPLPIKNTTPSQFCDTVNVSVSFDLFFFYELHKLKQGPEMDRERKERGRGAQKTDPPSGHHNNQKLRSMNMICGSIALWKEEMKEVTLVKKFENLICNVSIWLLCSQTARRQS